MERCRSLKRDGSPCSLPPVGDSRFCWAHDPNNSEKRKKTASKAGRVGKPAAELSALKLKLRQLGEDVLVGKVERATGSVVAQIYGVLLKAFEQERKIREQEEIIQRLEILEQAERTTHGGNNRWVR